MDQQCMEQIEALLNATTPADTTPCPASPRVKSLCFKRASNRWSTLLTKTKSRIGDQCGMRKRLGPANWATFVEYAEAKHKTAFFRAFTPVSGILMCNGELDGEPCPKKLKVDLTRISSIQCGEALEKLHLDHRYEVERVCKVWSQALPKEPKTWDDGLCGPLVAQLLFGTEDHPVARKNASSHPKWCQNLVFRCGNVQGVQGQRAADFCHDVDKLHTQYALDVKDIVCPCNATE